MEDGATSDANDTVLTCWKDIAKYLGKSVRTVQRWEQLYGLPVRRPKEAKSKSAVIARTADLKAWVESNWLDRNRQNGPDVKSLAAPNESVPDLLQAIEQLRNYHRALMLESAAALATLSAECAQLESTVASSRWRLPLNQQRY